MMKNSFIFFLPIAAILLNLLFQAGWDLWTRTFIQIMFLFSLWFLLSGRIVVTKFIKKPAILVLAVGIVISLCFSDYHILAISVFYDYIVYFLIFIISATFFQNKRDKVLKFILILGGLAAVLDFIYPLIFQINLFPNPHIKIGFFLLIIPIYLDTLLQKKSLTIKILPLIFFILILISFVQARSLWGTIVLIISILFYLKLTKKLPVILFIISFFSILFIFLQPIPEILPRVHWLKAGIEMIIANPLTGFGGGSTPHILPSFVSSEYLSLFIHSFFIEFAAEKGLISLIGLIWLLITLLKNIKNKSSPIIFISLLSVLIYNVFEYNLSIPLIASTFWLLAGSFTASANYSFSFKKNSHKLIFSLALFIPISFALIKITDPFISQSFYIKGIHYLKIGEYSSANKYFYKSLNIFDNYWLPRLGLALVNIYNDDLWKASNNIALSYPSISGGKSYITFKKGKSYLQINNRKKAKIKFLQAIRLRIIQHGLDPDGLPGIDLLP